MRTCPHCGAVCSTTGVQCAACGLDVTLAAEEQAGGAWQVTPIEFRTAPASRGVWQMIVDALLHGRSFASRDRRRDTPAQDVQVVMQEHVVEPARRIAAGHEQAAAERAGRTSRSA